MHRLGKLRTASAIASLALVTALLFFIDLADSPSAQEGAGAGTAEFAAKIVALEARVKELEDQKDKPVKAPFMVVDGSNKVIFHIDATGGNPLLQLSGTNGSAQMTVSQSGGLLRLSGGNRNVAVGLSSDYSGFASFVGGNSIAEFIDHYDGRYSVKIAAVGGGAPVFQAGYHGSGRPAISLWDGDNQVARLEQGDGSQGGALKLFNGGKEIVALGDNNGSNGLNISGAAGNSVFAGLMDDANPLIAFMKGKENVVALQTNYGEDSGVLFLNRGNEKRISLNAGDDSGLLIFKGKDPSLSAIVGEDGVGSFNLANGNNIVASLASQKAAPDSGQLTLYQDGKAALEAGAELNGPVTGLQIYDKGDEPVIDLSVTKAQPSLFIGDPKAFASLSINDDEPVLLLADANGQVGEFTGRNGRGTLSLFDGGSDKPSITLGPTKDKQRPAVRIYNKGELVFAAGVDPNGMGIAGSIHKDQIVAGVGADNAGNGNVFVKGSDGQVVASVNSMDNPGQGIVAVYNDGKSVAHMGIASSGGGNITMADPSGQGVFSAGYLPDGPGGACVEHEGTKCLGIGLTGLEGFH